MARNRTRSWEGQWGKLNKEASSMNSPPSQRGYAALDSAISALKLPSCTSYTHPMLNKGPHCIDCIHCLHFFHISFGRRGALLLREIHPCFLTTTCIYFTLCSTVHTNKCWDSKIYTPNLSENPPAGTQLGAQPLQQAFLRASCAEIWQHLHPPGRSTAAMLPSGTSQKVVLWDRAGHC